MHRVIIIPASKVHLSAVGVVLCIKIIGGIRTMGGKCQRNFTRGWIKKVWEGVGIT